MFPTPDATRRVEHLIDALGLHAETPVSIRSAIEAHGWRILDRDGIDPLYGLVVINGGHTTFAVNGDLERDWQRYILAQLLGHVLARDTGTLHLLEGDDWWRREEEEVATMIAAKLLIPEAVRRDYPEPADLARTCVVPEYLALWWKTVRALS